MQKEKKIVLYVFGFSDSETNKDVKDLYEKIGIIIKGDTKVKPNVAVLVGNQDDDIVNSNLGKLFNDEGKLLNVNLRGGSLCSKGSLVIINAVDGSKHYVKGGDLDYLMDPSEYIPYLVGVDERGILTYSAKELRNRGYTPYVVTDRCFFANKRSEDFIKKYKLRTVNFDSIGIRRTFEQKKKRNDRSKAV